MGAVTFGLELLLLTVLTTTIWHPVGTIKWLSFENTEWQYSDCKNSIFTSKQTRFCQRHINLMAFLPQSVELTKHECQEQMKNRRWNCSTINNAPRFSLDLKEDTREAAFVHALFSAALSYSVSRGCMSGRISGVVNCACTKRHIVQSSRRLNGVTEAIEYINCPNVLSKGINFARQFADWTWRKKRKYLVSNQIKLHNSRVGRMSVARKLEVECRCHGVSGACAVKNCWKQLPKFNAISNDLHLRYDKAIKVVYDPRHGFVPQWANVARVAQQEMMYAYESPNYCDQNAKLGVLGTSGRQCNKSSNGNDGCGVLCCGRGVDITTTEIVERCSCKYLWCCQVKCRECRSVQDVYTCK